jgi:hypothetical protein
MQQERLYTVRTSGGFIFNISATSLAEAQRKAQDPALSRNISSMIRLGLREVESVQPNREHPLKITHPVFGDEFFK